jgi:hypothetical protein
MPPFECTLFHLVVNELCDPIYQNYSIKTHKEVKPMFYHTPIKKSSQSSLNSAPLQELVVVLDEQNNAFKTVQQLYEELTDGQAEAISGGGNSAPPCADDNDTECYSLIDLECRVVASTGSQLSRLRV